MSEEVALAAADLATVEQLRARILEWEDCYDRLAGAFDLHMALYECEQAMSAYVAVFYDVVLGELGAELEAARTVVQAAREWREAVEQLNGVYAAEQALIAALKACGS